MVSLLVVVALSSVTQPGTDMYLPAVPTMARQLDTTASGDPGDLDRVHGRANGRPYPHARAVPAIANPVSARAAVTTKLAPHASPILVECTRSNSG